MSDFHNEPITGFTAAADREKFASALRFVRGEFKRDYPLIIGGERIDTGEWFVSVNPSAPAEIVGRASAATRADADHAVAAAQRALPSWRAVPFAGRAHFLRRAANAVRKRRFELAAFVLYEVGKPWREADADVAEAIDYLEFYAVCAERLARKPRRRDIPGEDNRLIHEPKGVCAVIAPWSFPLALLTNMTAAALVTGNTVIIKPASLAPVCAAKLMEIFDAVGLPPGVLNYLPGPGTVVGTHLVTHPDVNVISFTGSRDVGTHILRAAADTPPTQKHIKKVISELGGKNAIIVDDDADLDEAVTGVVASAFGYSGQKCTACSRVVVLTRIYAEFCTRLADAARELTIGPAEDPGTVVGPIIDAAAYDMIQSFLPSRELQFAPTPARSRSPSARSPDEQPAQNREGRVILQRHPDNVPGRGLYIGPAIIADVPPDAPIAQEEIFGPVLTVLKADDFTHALAIANGTRYALTGGLYSRSPAHIEQGKRDFLVGNLYINRKITGSRVGIEPFGGLKMSGDGAKAGGPDYLQHYCNARTITEHTLRHGLAPAQEVQSNV